MRRRAGRGVAVPQGGTKAPRTADDGRPTGGRGRGQGGPPGEVPAEGAEVRQRADRTHSRPSLVFLLFPTLRTAREGEGGAGKGRTKPPRGEGVDKAGREGHQR